MLPAKGSTRLQSCVLHLALELFDFRLELLDSVHDGLRAEFPAAYGAEVIGISVSDVLRHVAEVDLASARRTSHEL